jgi:hypothetical protein
LAGADRLLLRIFARRCGVYLALAALTLQFALSFGHMHRHDIVASTIIPPTIISPNIVSPNIVSPNIVSSNIVSSNIVDSQIVAGRQAPARLDLSRQLPSGLADDDDLCWICFSAQLLATTFIPDAPQPSPSFDFKDADRSFGHVADRVPTSRRAPFQSRAPPLV